MAKIVVFMPTLAGGGAERVTLTWCAGLVRHGHQVWLVLGTREGALSGSVPPEVHIHDLGVARVRHAARGLFRFVRREQPDVVISALTHASVMAAFVVKVLWRRSRLIVMHHNTTSTSRQLAPRRRDRIAAARCGVAYRLADRVIAVSRGVAVDLSKSSHLPISGIDVLPNPIEYERIRRLAEGEVDESLLPGGDAELVLAVGRLELQKGFDTLLRAVAQMDTPCRLVILGEGPSRAELESLAARLGIADRVSLPGFVLNPYPYFARAGVYALSSRWEGLPTVLLEALAFRLRIVSTNCPAGPDEILANVEGAELVPVDDVARLAHAIGRAISAGPLTRPRDDWRKYDEAQVVQLLSDVVEDVVGAG